jgi:predicted DNA-binding transcriptional regulator YafY
MRADRLLSILMYLQVRGRTTTDRLAAEFEVSRRTIIRDLYALRVAGFPVYTETGPHGGCYLHEEYRNTLTQLTTDEVAALFLSSMRKPLEDLGLSGPLRGAVLKLTAALPESRQAAKSRVADRIVIDSAPWSGRAEPIGQLDVLYRAAMHDRWVSVSFQRPFDTISERRIAPYGLVAKAGAWFCVWVGEDGRLRVDRTSRVREAEMEESQFERPADFDLDFFWTAWRERQEVRPAMDVKLRVRKDALDYVRDALGEQLGIFPVTANVKEAWTEIDVKFPFFEDARRDLLALGGAVEVISPTALRVSLIDFAEQAIRVYRGTRDVD